MESRDDAASEESASDAELLAIIEEMLDQSPQEEARSLAAEQELRDDPFKELLEDLSRSVAECSADEHACTPLKENLNTIEAIREQVEDPFAQILKELEESAATCAMDDAQCDPFMELLEELERANDVVKQNDIRNPFESMMFDDTTDEPVLSWEQIHQLARELAEDVVAEAAENAGIPFATAAAMEMPSETVYGRSENESKLAEARAALIRAREALQRATELMKGDRTLRDQLRPSSDGIRRALHLMDPRVTEGIFDGEHMVTDEGHLYEVPANYASKSKLVEGDMLKLMHLPDGKALFRQIGPMPRERVQGILSCDERGGYCVFSNGSRYKVIPASVTYHRARPGDQVVALIPRGAPAKYAAVDFIMHQ